eukprot:2403821-Pyramimonas_sp.AAC.1
MGRCVGGTERERLLDWTACAPATMPNSLILLYSRFLAHGELPCGWGVSSYPGGAHDEFITAAGWR